MTTAEVDRTVVEGERSRVVEERDCASQWGNDGLYVLSTPAILGHMEQTCVDVLAPVLREGEMTVGVSVTMSHTAPARRGDTVTYQVRLTRESRDIEVEFTVVDAGGVVISQGSHARKAVDRETFIRRLAPPSG